MSQYPNSGTLGANKYKQPGTNQADFRGKATVTCPHCQKESAFIISGWTRQGNSGDFTSLKFEDQASADKRKVQVKPERPPMQEKPSSKPCNEDDVPF